MKTTFAFIGKRNYKKVLESFKNNYKNYDLEVIFLTNEDLDRSNFQDDEINHKFLIFDEYASENEMIEYLFQNETLNKVLLIKESYVNFNYSDISRLLNESQKKDVVIAKQNKEDNIFKRAWKKCKAFVIKLILGFKLYNSEADIIALSPLATSIVKQSPGRSAMFCKLNSWSGLKVSESVIVAQPKQNSKNKSKFSLSSLIPSGLLLLMIIGHIIFAVLKIHLPFLALISYILVEIVLLLITLMSFTKFLFFKKFGKINFINPAVLVKTIDNTL